MGLMVHMVLQNILNTSYTKTEINYKEVINYPVPSNQWHIVRKNKYMWKDFKYIMLLYPS